jgi:hypothetical protein
VPDPADTVLVFKNLDKVEAELDGKWDNGISGRVSYSFQDVTDGKTGQTLANSPRNLAKANLTLPLLKDRSDVIHVCIIGDDPFGPSLATIEGKTAGGRSLETRRLTSLQQAGGCEMLYIAGSEERDLERFFEAVKDTPVLTIGDTEGFTQRGLMVNFYMENNRVLFEINPNAAMRAGLKISSALLRIARIVGGP